MDTIDAAYLPLVIQEAAGIPLDPSFEEQKNIMLRCKGVSTTAGRRGSPPPQPAPDQRRHDQGIVAGSGDRPIHNSLEFVIAGSVATKQSSPFKCGLLRFARNDE